MTSSTYVLYDYVPSLGGAVAFAILFAATTTVHLFQRIRTHAKYFNPFIVGGFCKWHYGRNLTQDACSNFVSSPGNRLCSPCRCSLQQHINYRLRSANPSHPTRPHSICRLHLHDPRQNHHLSPCAASERGASQMDDEDLRFRRYYIFPAARSR